MSIATADLAALQFQVNDPIVQRTQKLERLRVALVSVDQRLNLSIMDLPLADPAIALLRHRIYDTSWTFNAALSYAEAGIAASGTPALRLRKNGAQVGTITFTGTSGVAAFTDPSFVTNDLFEIYPPSTADLFLDQLSVSLSVTIV